METNQNDLIDYKKSVSIKSSKKLVFQALTEQIDQWWSTIENTANKEGDIFKISFAPESYWKFKVLSIIEPKNIVWECVESHQDHNLKGIDEEWLHSKLYWTISGSDNNVEVQFLHKGLVTTGICYEVCFAAWDFYLLDSLKSYLETGTGKPNEK